MNQAWPELSLGDVLSKSHYLANQATWLMLLSIEHGNKGKRGVKALQIAKDFFVFIRWLPQQTTKTASFYKLFHTYKPNSSTNDTWVKLFQTWGFDVEDDLLSDKEFQIFCSLPF